MKPSTHLKLKPIFLLFLCCQAFYSQTSNSANLNFASQQYGRQIDAVAMNVSRDNKIYETVSPQFEDKTERIGLAYSGYVVSKETGDRLANVKIELQNPVTGESSVVTTDESGNYSFILPYGQKSQMVFSVDGFAKETKTVKAKNGSRTAFTNNRIYLVPFNSLVENEADVTKIKIDPFDSGRQTSNNTEKIEDDLEKVLYTMLKFPDTKIRIETYANTTDTYISNLLKSDIFAKSSRRYLIAQGVDPSRIESATGYGEYSADNKWASSLPFDEQILLEKSHSDFIIISH